MRDDFGVFLGTNLFLFEEGRLDRPAEVRFVLPTGWRIATALTGSGAGPYTAATYRELADAMTFVGAFSLDSLTVDAKWVRVAVWPADTYTAPVARSPGASVERIFATQNRLFGGPACHVYTAFFNVIREAGAPLALVVRRGGRTVTLATQVRERTVTSWSLAPAGTPTPKAARIWRGLATGTTGR